jgi:hypothetical protein
VITGILALATGGVGISIAGANAVFGKMLFGSFRARLNLDTHGEHLIASTVYGDWSRGVFWDAMTGRPGMGMAFSVVTIVVLMVHVLNRRTLDVDEAGISIGPPLSRSKRISQWVRRQYRKHYFAVTIVIMALFLIELGHEKEKNWLIGSFFLLAVPSAAYTVLNWKDVTKKSRLPAQVCYICLVVAFLVSVYLLPNQYGGEAWNPTFRRVTQINNTPLPADRNIFAIDETHTPMLLASITVQPGDSLFVEFTNKDSVVALETQARPIRTWAAEFRRPRLSPTAAWVGELGR